jgi:hypothetical protein
MLGRSGLSSGWPRENAIWDGLLGGSLEDGNVRLGGVVGVRLVAWLHVVVVIVRLFFVFHFIIFVEVIIIIIWVRSLDGEI